jgi:excisionase family DNA binding protein
MPRKKPPVGATTETVPQPSPSIPDRLLHPKGEAAQLLGISMRAVEYLLNQGRLRYRKIGGRTLIARTELERFVRGDQPELIVTRPQLIRTA